MTRRRSDVRLHLVILLLIAAGYVTVRVGVAPTGGFLRHHATDILAGAALPSLMTALVPASQPLGGWIRSVGG